MIAQQMVSKADSEHYSAISSSTAPMGRYLVVISFATALMYRIEPDALILPMSSELHTKHSVVVYEKTWVVSAEFPWVMLQQMPRVWHKKLSRAT